MNVSGSTVNVEDVCKCVRVCVSSGECSCSVLMPAGSQIVHSLNRITGGDV